MLVTGCQRFASARSRLSQCAGAVSLAVSQSGDKTTVRWPKWADFQGLQTRESPESRPRVALSETPPHTHTQEEKKEREPAPPGASISPRVRGLSPPPEALSDEEMRRLVGWAQRHRFTADQCLFSIEAVFGWARAGNKRKADWVQTVMNAMREGWALKGHAGSPQPGRYLTT